MTTARRGSDQLTLAMPVRTEPTFAWAVPALRGSQEFRHGPLRAKTPSSRTVVQQVLAKTSTYLHTSRRWKEPGAYPDAIRRLAFMRHLKTHDVNAWWFNAYFFDPWRQYAGVPALSSDWERLIAEVRRSLALSVQHPLSPFITHEYFRPAWLE